MNTSVTALVESPISPLQYVQIYRQNPRKTVTVHESFCSLRRLGYQAVQDVQFLNMENVKSIRFRIQDRIILEFSIASKLEIETMLDELNIPNYDINLSKLISKYAETCLDLLFWKTDFFILETFSSYVNPAFEFIPRNVDLPHSIDISFTAIDFIQDVNSLSDGHSSFLDLDVEYNLSCFGKTCYLQCISGLFGYSKQPMKKKLVEYQYYPIPRKENLNLVIECFQNIKPQGKILTSPLRTQWMEKDI
jgi:hypothetical protein